MSRIPLNFILHGSNSVFKILSEKTYQQNNNNNNLLICYQETTSEIFVGFFYPTPLNEFLFWLRKIRNSLSSQHMRNTLFLKHHNKAEAAALVFLGIGMGGLWQSTSPLKENKIHSAITFYWGLTSTEWKILEKNRWFPEGFILIFSPPVAQYLLLELYVEENF